MPYIKPGEGDVFHRTLDDLITDLVAKPGELFMRDSGCEALVYVQEFDQILLIECKNIHGSPELCKEELKQKLIRIKEGAR